MASLEDVLETYVSPASRDRISVASTLTINSTIQANLQTSWKVSIDVALLRKRLKSRETMMLHQAFTESCATVHPELLPCMWLLLPARCSVSSNSSQVTRMSPVIRPLSSVAQRPRPLLSSVHVKPFFLLRGSKGMHLCKERVLEG